MKCTFRQNEIGLRNVSSNSYTDYKYKIIFTLLIDPPSVNPLEVHYPTEFSDLQVYCSATPGNPPNHVYYWTRLGDDNFRQNGTYLELYSISRNETGRYICTAVNSYSTGGEGKDSQTLSVNVQCKEIYIEFFISISLN